MEGAVLIVYKYTKGWTAAHSILLDEGATIHAGTFSSL